MKHILYLFLIIFCSVPVYAEGILCPLRPDPPPSINGNLSEWHQSPGAIEVKEENIVWGKEHWKGEKDLAGTLWLGWDNGYLYLAAEVIDDIFSQNQSGEDMYQGDHLELYLDTKYQKGVTGKFAEGQFQLGLSPGNLSSTGDPLFDVPPEGVIFIPAGGLDASEVQVAALRAEQGYSVEARIPWKVFGIKPGQGMVLGINFCVSDTDTPKSQDTMSSMFLGMWKGPERSHLVPVKLGDTMGK